MIRWLARLQNLDPRWLYLAILSIIVPLCVDIPVPAGRVSSATRGLFDAIESCPPDKVVWVDSSWDWGSQSENRAQLKCVARHLCRKGVKFVVTSVGVTPFAPQLADEVIRPIAAEAGYVYGRDWVNTGYVQASAGVGMLVQGLAKDFHRLRPTDVAGKPLAELPLMDRVRTIGDIHLVYCVTYSPSEEWISFVRQQYGTPVAFGCMMIMTSLYYTYLDSGQLCGMLAGNRGAAEYETLVGQRDLGTRLILAGAFGNGVILLAILLGNLGMWAGRKHNGQRKSMAEEP